MTLQVTVKSDEIIKKVVNLFRGNLETVLQELIQNARRAHCKELRLYIEDMAHRFVPERMKEIKPELNKDEHWIVLRDDGDGMDYFNTLLQIGESGWDESIMKESPAGMGFFSLAGRYVFVRSKGKEIIITPEDWAGNKIEERVVEDDGYTTLGFIEERTSFTTYATSATNNKTLKQYIKIITKFIFYYTIKVYIQDKRIELPLFIDLSKDPKVIRSDDIGCDITLYPISIYMEDIYISTLDKPVNLYYSSSVGEYIYFNYFGQIITHQYIYLSKQEHKVIRELFKPLNGSLRINIDINSKLTPKLPNRTSMIPNDALKKVEHICFNLLLEKALSKKHRYSYAVYEMAVKRGIDCVEALVNYDTDYGDGKYGYDSDAGYTCYGYCSEKDLENGNIRVILLEDTWECSYAARVTLCELLGTLKNIIVRSETPRNKGYSWYSPWYVVDLDTTYQPVLTLQGDPAIHYSYNNDDCIYLGKDIRTSIVIQNKNTKEKETFIFYDSFGVTSEELENISEESVGDYNVMKGLVMSKKEAERFECGYLVSIMGGVDYNWCDMRPDEQRLDIQSEWDYFLKSLIHPKAFDAQKVLNIIEECFPHAISIEITKDNLVITQSNNIAPLVFSKNDL